MSVKQVAEQLGLSSHTVRRRIRQGDLRAYRVGRGSRSPLRVPAAAVDELLALGCSSRGVGATIPPAADSLTVAGGLAHRKANPT